MIISNFVIKKLVDFDLKFACNAHKGIFNWVRFKGDVLHHL